MNVGLHSSLAEFARLNAISICTGGGGLDLGLELAIPGYRPVAYVEREAFACAHLVAAMEQGLMAPAPLWSDARTFPGRQFRGRVDCVVGGIPCQPHSVAGKRLGREDERDLWSSFRRILVQTGAWCALIENVPGMVTSGGLERVWRDLHRLGFAVEAGLFSAEEVGASHGRERLFVLAVHQSAFWRLTPDDARPLADVTGGGLADGNSERLQGQWADSDAQGWKDARRSAGLCGGADLVDSACERRGEGRAEPELRRGRCAAASDGQPMADSGSGEGEQRCWADEIGRRSGETQQAGLGRRELAHTDEPEFRRLASAGEQPLRQQDAGNRGELVNSDGSRRAASGVGRSFDPGCEPVEGCGRVADNPGGGIGGLSIQPGRPDQTGADVDGGWNGLVNAIRGGCDGREDEPLRRPVGRIADEAASRDGDCGAGEWPLFAPGPGDGIWRTVAALDPLRLPALSRHDMFLHACRDAGLDPYGHQGGAGGPAARVHAAELQEIAQRTLRRMADGLAGSLDQRLFGSSRIDALRMLGNGVVSLAGAHAIRTLGVAIARRHGADPARFIWRAT